MKNVIKKSSSFCSEDIKYKPKRRNSINVTIGINNEELDVFSQGGYREARLAGLRKAHIDLYRDREFEKKAQIYIEAYS